MGIDQHDYRNGFVKCVDGIWREATGIRQPYLGRRKTAQKHLHEIKGEEVPADFIEAETSLDVIAEAWLKTKEESNEGNL